MKIVYIILGTLFIFLGLSGDPMSFAFALWMFSLVYKNQLQQLFLRFPTLLTFFGVGFLTGLFIEALAIINNLPLPPAERVLMSPDPLTDIVFGLFYYGLLMLVWTLLLRQFPYSTKEIFLLTGLLGIATEGVGEVFIGAVTNPFGYGGLYALIVMCIYGIFPFMGRLAVGERIRPKQPQTSTIKRYSAAALGIFLFIALFGNYVLPILRAVFEA